MLGSDSTRRGLICGCGCVLAVAGLWPAVARSQPAIGALLPPVAAACISSPFGPRALPGPHAAAFHTGIDFPAPEGAWVHAAVSGRVLQIRRLGSAGLIVDLLHEDPGGSPFVTRYAHLGTVAPALADGRRTVAAGAALGRIGRSGITYGTHLHFEVRVAGEPINPEPFFDVVRCTQRSSGL
jgi:murein DD-endopeptidase MepM/ murein hydrolase activator NlpD